MPLFIAGCCSFLRGIGGGRSLFAEAGISYEVLDQVSARLDEFRAKHALSERRGINLLVFRIGLRRVASCNTGFVPVCGSRDPLVAVFTASWRYPYRYNCSVGV
ncbi:MAG: hypothetical protein R2912_06275 [Eubacteriales bacterium]